MLQTQAEQVCECWSSSIRNKGREQNCSSLNPPVSIPKLLARNSSVRRTPLVHSPPTKHPTQTFVSSSMFLVVATLAQDCGCFPQNGIINPVFSLWISGFLHADHRLPCCPQQCWCYLWRGFSGRAGIYSITIH